MEHNPVFIGVNGSHITAAQVLLSQCTLLLKINKILACSKTNLPKTRRLA
jgi:hypothetical protein